MEGSMATLRIQRHGSGLKMEETATLILPNGMEYNLGTSGSDSLKGWADKRQQLKKYLLDPTNQTLEIPVPMPVIHRELVLPNS